MILVPITYVSYIFHSLFISLGTFTCIFFIQQGNWTYSAGVGADPREDRYFHPVKQGTRYDKNGDYIRHWLKEISKDVPAHALMNPWKHGIVLSSGGTEEDSKRVSSSYPSRPIVNMMGFEWKPKSSKKNVERPDSKKKRRNRKKNKSRVQHF